MKFIDKEVLASAFNEAWSPESSTLWKSENPALGQCGVTALVAQDYLGGKILKTNVVKYGVDVIWHFYNEINGVLEDFTMSQFDEPITYDNKPSNREEAFADTSSQQYDSLKSAVERYSRNT